MSGQTAVGLGENFVSSPSRYLPETTRQSFMIVRGRQCVYVNINHYSFSVQSTGNVR